MNIYHIGIKQIDGPLIVVDKVKEAHYDEVVNIITPTGNRKGRVVWIENEKAAIQVFSGTSELSITNTKTEFLGHPILLKVSKNLLGRILNGSGEPIDNLGVLEGTDERDINSSPINPVSRIYPKSFIETGFSAIDGLTTLIRGQKLPIFSASGLPHEKLAALIASQSNIKDSGNFCVVFGAIGVKNDTASFFKKEFIKAGVMDHTVMIVNTSSDPIIERILTPRIALTAAEYLAYTLNMHVLVILTDMTAYCEALREFSSSKGEIPGRKGFPGYMYSDLASIYERAGIVKTATGSITQIPILTMPNEDITHPIPDLTGYITEGQIVLSKDLVSANIFPPISILPSLSRLMKDGIGEGFTRKDHQTLANQIFASYSRTLEIKSLAAVIGEDELGDNDRLFLSFGRLFETHYINQTTKRSIIETLNLGWELLSILPRDTLTNTPSNILDEYYNNKAALLKYKL
ncbi:MAG: V-type ATP synthase subunit B [Acholeplasmatales bacterium]|jgi:V/A-type H+-transporting ATPase subunit B|nr:V-type ATP synthase subunit B [Acholeplasmatales bacterium]